jgi:hypothetical protein
VVISACTYWSWDNYAGSVDGLPDARKVDSAGYFFDEDGGESFGTEFLVHAEVVDLGGCECSGYQ